MNKIMKNISLVTIQPWLVIGAVIILAPIFIFWTSENIHKQKEITTRLLIEKGAALIRSFEAGTRTGMMGMHWGGVQVQTLLTETAQQEDIAYLLITDQHGKILAHDDPSRIGQFHGQNLDVGNIAGSKEIKWRRITDSKGTRVFEVFRQFTPTRRHHPRHFEMMRSNDWFRSKLRWKENMPDFQLAIFVGLDIETVDTATQEDTRHTVIMAIILLLIGFTGIILLFLGARYREATTSLSRVTAFSDSLVDNMPIGLIAADADDTVTSMNHAAESILRIDDTDIRGRKIRHTLAPVFIECIDKLKTEGGIVEKEIEYPLDNGIHIPLEVATTALREDDGTFWGYVILFRDLTEIQRLRKEIERSQRLASLGRLAAGIAHEIRNPLSSIKGFATYFRDRYRDVPEDAHTAEIMIQEVERLNRVIGELLEFARPMDIQVRKTPLETFIQHIVKMTEAQRTEKHIRFAMHIAPELKEIMIDPDRMSQVFLNLFLNAMDAMDEGGTLELNISRDATGKLLFSISDTGKGIDPQDLGKIFDPYFTTKPSGTGLGLAIVHRIVEAHGGQIRVNSTPERGTTISFTLPDTYKGMAFTHKV